MNKPDTAPAELAQIAELAGVDAAGPLALMLAAGTQQAVSTALKDWQHTARACVLLLFAAVAGGVSIALYNLVTGLS